MPGTPEKKRRLNFLLFLHLCILVILRQSDLGNISRFSRRAWDGAVRQWKLRVHAESRKVLEKAGWENVDSSSTTRAENNINFKEVEHVNKKEEGVDVCKDLSQNTAEEAIDATSSNVMEVKLEYKPVTGELLHPNDPEEDELVKSGEAKKGKVKIITI